MPEEPEIIEEEQETPEEEPETIDPTFTGYKVLIYDRGEENATWQVLLDTSSGENPGIVKASVENKLNEPGQFSYTIAPTHPLYDKTSPMRVYVSVREGQIEIFYGRILSVQTNPLTKLKAVACEGALAFLLDAELPIDTEDREMSAADYFKYCIRQYNSAIKIDSETYDELRRLRIGDIDVEDSSEIHSFKNGSYTQIQSVMKSQLLNAYDGCFKIRSVPVRNPFGFGPTTYNHYIDWIDLVGTLNVSHSVRPGINVIDQTNTKSGEDFFTIIRPVGNNDLMLSSNNGLINVSSSMVDEYGKIIRTVNFDADNESTLRTKANKYIRKLRDNRLTITGDISFVDYNMLIDDVGDGLSVHVGDRVGLYKDLDYIDASAIVESLTRDLLDPSKDKMSLKSDKDLLKSDHASGAAGSNNSGVKASTKISRGGGGGGSSITEYIKSATLSTDGKTLTLTPAHGTPIDFSKATTLEGAWSSGTLTVSAYQTNKGTKTNVGSFVSDHLLALARGGSEISEAFRAELRTVDTGEDVIYPNLRISKDIYLYENVSGMNSVVVAGGNIDGSNPVASISVRSTYYAGKASVELNDPTWDPATTTSGTYVESNTAKVRTSGRTSGSGVAQEKEKEVKVFLTKGTTWTNNKLTVFLHSGTIDGPVQAATEVDASSIRYAGKASVELTDPSWNPTSNPIPSSQKITVQTVNRTDASGRSEEITKEALVFLTQGTWSNNKLKVYLKSGSTEGTTRAETEVDASELVSATATEARRAGKYSVTLTDPAWNPTGSTYPESQKITVTTVNRTDLSGNPDEITKETLVFLTKGTTWANNKLMVYLKSGSAEGTTRAATEVDASSLVSDATTAGINTGKASVSLNDLTWTPTSNPLQESQTITARTSGRTTSTLKEIEKTLSLSLAKGTTWTDNKLTVTLKAGSGSTPIAEVSVDASDLVSDATSAGRAEYKALVRTRFGSSQSGQSTSYFIEGYENTSGYASISGSSTEYKLGVSGSEDTAVVQIQNLSGTRLSNTAELSIGQLYIDGYNVGNANRGSRILSPTVVTSTVDTTLSIGTRYNISSQYRQADGTWASGGSTVVGVPAVASRFMSGSNNSYYIESYEVTSSATSVPGSTYDYKLGITGEKASSVVRLLTVNNGTIANTPTLNIGSLYILGQNDLKDAGGAVGPIETNGTTTLNQYVTKLTVEVPSSAGYRGLEVGKSSESLAFYNRILASTTSTTASIGIGLNTGSVSTGSGVRTVRVYLGGQAGPYAEIYDYRDGKAAERASIKSRFIHDGTNYCIEGYDSSSIETSRTVFTLGVKNSAVRILNSSGNVIGSTPYYSLSNNTYYESGYEAGHSDGWNEGGQTADVAVSTSISSLPSGETSNGTLNAWGKYVRVRPKYTNSEGTEVTITTAEKSLYYRIPSLTSKEYTVSPGETKTIEDINAPISSIKITASNPTISVDDDHASWYSSSASLPSVNATLSRVGTLIRTYKNQYGYVYFSVTAGSKTNTYRIPVQPN